MKQAAHWKEYQEWFDKGFVGFFDDSYRVSTRRDETTVTQKSTGTSIKIFRKYYYVTVSRWHTTMNNSIHHMKHT